MAGNQLYGRSMRLLNHDLPRMGFSAGLADPTDVNAFKKALKANTKIILLEVVSNPTLRIAEFEAIADLARESGALLVVDNTFTQYMSKLVFGILLACTQTLGKTFNRHCSPKCC